MESLSLRGVYRRLLNHLRLIPDTEIRCYYYQRCRSLADAVAESERDGPIVGVPSRDPSRIFTKLQRELRSIEEVVKGDTTKYSRMMDITYARRGKRRWEFLDTIYPPSLQRPLPDPSSTLERRSQPPSPYPAHIAPLIPKKRTQENEPRASLKPVRPRMLANRLWDERSTEIGKMVLPLAVRVMPRRTGKDNQEKQVLSQRRSIEWDEIEGLLVGMTKNEAQRLRNWFILADRMTHNLEQLKTIEEYPVPVRIAHLRRASQGELSGRPLVRRPASPRFAIPLRKLRRMYTRFVDELPVLLGSYPAAPALKKQEPTIFYGIKWRAEPGKGSGPKVTVMSPEEAEWIVV